MADCSAVAVVTVICSTPEKRTNSGKPSARRTSGVVSPNSEEMPLEKMGGNFSKALGTVARDFVGEWQEEELPWNNSPSLDRG
jgi:hypothetical protein